MSTHANPLPAHSNKNSHPIDTLIFDSQHKFTELVSKQTKTLEEAAQAYRKRRGRHPPPGFDKWFEHAQSHNALLVEDFFDQIYHDLGPFWGVDSIDMRRGALRHDMRIKVEKGVASSGSGFFWTEAWLAMIKKIEHLLPDMEIALNAMDEPRMIAPYEDIEKFMAKAAKTAKLVDPRKVITEFGPLPDAASDGEGTAPKFVGKETNPFWNLARRGCPPKSLARTTPVMSDWDHTPVFNTSLAKPHTHQGFVSNSTLSSDICHQPDLQGLVGVFVEPLSTSTTDTLYPLFGGSKLAVNNEILIPAAMYYKAEERFTGGGATGAEWAAKENKVVWRGVATGGRNRNTTWKAYQRHRFVAMSNGTKLTRAETGLEDLENCVMPEPSYKLPAQQDHKLGDWVGGWTDVGLTDIHCFPAQEDLKCEYNNHAFEKVDPVDLRKQFDCKYLPDIDGNSYSGRYLSFLQSSSLPIKSTVWREWHDSRLVAWKHFVPMDNRFTDYYGIMDYFIGYNGQGGHDAAAEKIAAEGKEWAEKVLRKEDMEIYVARALMEYGRLIDDRRESLGWVADVINKPTLMSKWKQW